MGKSDAVHSECHELMAIWIGGIRKDFKEWNASNWSLENGEGFFVFVVVCLFFLFLFFKPTHVLDCLIMLNLKRTLEVI